VALQGGNVRAVVVDVRVTEVQEAYSAINLDLDRDELGRLFMALLGSELPLADLNQLLDGDVVVRQLLDLELLLLVLEAAGLMPDRLRRVRDFCPSRLQPADMHDQVPDRDPQLKSSLRSHIPVALKRSQQLLITKFSNHASFALFVVRIHSCLNRLM